VLRGGRLRTDVSFNAKSGWKGKAVARDSKVESEEECELFNFGG
jgi:hypothetical protein